MTKLTDKIIRDMEPPERGNRIAFLLFAIPILPLAALSQLIGLGLDRIQHLDRNTLGYVLVARKPQ